MLDIHTHLSTLVELTRDVKQWYALGMFLSLSKACLETIKQKYGGYSQEGLPEMLRMWLETKQATWSDLVHSLWKVGHISLARKIAAEIGKPLHDYIIAVLEYYCYFMTHRELVRCSLCRLGYRQSSGK